MNNLHPKLLTCQEKPVGISLRVSDSSLLPIPSGISGESFFNLRRNMKKQTKHQLSLAVGNRLGMTHQDGKRITNAVFDSLREILSEGNTVELRNFGTFHIRELGERPGRNPRTGETFRVPPKTKVLFRSGKALGEGVNQ